MVIAGTGHRPDKLGGYHIIAHNTLTSLAEKYLEKEQPSLVISGGALGWDQALAAAAMKLNLPLVVACPFKGFESKWPTKSVGWQFHKGLEEAENYDMNIQLVYISKPGYAPWKMQVRNKWMVDKADKLVALWNGSDGGTANCIKYAQEVGKPFDNVWEDFLATGIRS